MKQICEHCKKETEGYQMTVNREKWFVCLTCKKQSMYVPFVHPNFNELYASIISLDFEGSHNSTYGRDYN